MSVRFQFDNTKLPVSATPGGLQFNVEDGTLHIFLYGDDRTSSVDIWVPLDEAKRDLMFMLKLIKFKERRQGG